MKPTAADTERVMPTTPRPTRPPSSATGMLTRMIVASHTEPNAENRSKNVSRIERQDEGEPLHRALLVLELAAPQEVVAGGELDAGGDLLARFVDERAEVAVAHVHPDADVALAGLARDQPDLVRAATRRARWGARAARGAVVQVLCERSSPGPRSTRWSRTRASSACRETPVEVICSPARDEDTVKSFLIGIAAHSASGEAFWLPRRFSCVS
jgi:hypothetical protein